MLTKVELITRRAWGCHSWKMREKWSKMMSKLPHMFPYAGCDTGWPRTGGAQFSYVDPRGPLEFIVF